ncbi:MAG: DUF1553 domain-containing protein [Planctomycetaceae bacterium]
MRSSLILLCCALTTQAVDAASLRIDPAEFTLNGQRAEQQLVITADDGTEQVRDVTTGANVTVADANVARVEGGKVFPVGDGTTALTVELNGTTATATVTVTNAAVQSPISFQHETLAALTKAGCNMGACHGSPSGKGGFRLSLRGYDPPLDILTLRTEYQGRRTNVMAPDESLLLRKPLMEVAHAGGKRLRHGDPSHMALRTWIAEGLQTGQADEPALDRIEVFPKKRVFHEGSDQQQIVVTGFFTDGSKRDLTPLTVFSSSAETVASVDENGLVVKEGKGETAILARYLDKMDTTYVTFLENVEGFQWSEPEADNFIDRLANDKLKQLQIPPSELCTDDEFLRRLTLDLAGRLPTIEEATQFLQDASPDKRERVIARLLDSPDHAAFWSLKWADVLRANSNKLKSPGVHKFLRWIYAGVLNDQPMDDFARELLTAQGSVFENPAANYWRASRDPTDAVETTAQLFLGIRMQCAKCHNHPFERWSQDNYYGVAAAFARVGRKPGATPDEEVIFVQDGGEVTQPRTGKTMPVHLLLQGDVNVPAGEDRRAAFADWLTKPDNPFFARAAVNRIWGHLLGRGIVEPVDDFRDSNPPSNASLLDELAKQFVEHGYSRKWIIHQIVSSRTYQRSARTTPLNDADELYFSHAVPRMLTAEQLLDSICAVTNVQEAFNGVPPGTPAAHLPEPPTDNYFLKIFGQPQREMACECERSTESNLSQALQMINGPTVHNKLRDDKGRIHQLIAAEKSNEEIIKTIYLAAVSREPSETEMQASLAHIANNENRQLALEDIGWAVMNSKEFLFQH